MINGLINYNSIAEQSLSLGIATWITAISTLLMMVATCFMAFFAWIAVDSCKNQQKRQKLINLLEGLNKYIQELQLYELESIVYSKQSKNIPEKDFTNRVFLNNEIKLIDNEMAEEFGSCSLLLKNWLIDNEEHEQILNEICAKMQVYRISIYDYNNVKKEFVVQMHTQLNIKTFKIDPILVEDFKKLKSIAIENRKNLTELINKFKELNKKLLK